MITAPTDPRWKTLQELEAYIERAREEWEAEDSRGEDDYECDRAGTWLGTLEDRRTRLLQSMGLDDE